MIATTLPTDLIPPVHIYQRVRMSHRGPPPGQATALVFKHHWFSNSSSTLFNAHAPAPLVCGLHVLLEKNSNNKKQKQMK